MTNREKYSSDGEKMVPDHPLSGKKGNNPNPPTPAKPGTKRPHRFTPPVRKKYLKLLKQGMGRYRAARTVGVNPQTVTNFMNGNPKFAEQVELAVCEIDDEVENALYETAIGGHHQAQQFWLTNRRPDRWKDMRFGGGNKTTVTSVHDNVKIEQSVENADPEDIVQLIKQVRSLGGQPQVIETEARRLEHDEDEK